MKVDDLSFVELAKLTDDVEEYVVEIRQSGCLAQRQPTELKLSSDPKIEVH